MQQPLRALESIGFIGAIESGGTGRRSDCQSPACNAIIIQWAKRCVPECGLAGCLV
jgi:hypothetical protein